MSKVLIDRAVLEATLEHAEFVSGAACEADDAIRAVLVAPSGTPELPVKAYYYEAPNEHGGFNKSVGLEVRKTFADAPLVLESDALMQIACLEGEIAKRDARIVELEYNYQDCNANKEAFASNAISLQESNTKLRAELAAIKAQEPVAYIPVDRETGEEWHPVLKKGSGNICDYRPLYAAPVSEAKAQGVVMPEPFPQNLPAGDVSGAAYEAGYNNALAEVARLNAAPVQQVSVPDGWKLVPVNATEAILDVLYSNGMDESDSLLQDIWSAMLAAAPAAPAADAGLVEALEKLARLGNGNQYGSSDGNMIAQAALAAHRAKGVV